MEEKRLKVIFKEYDPELSSRMAFMERLERNLNAVEIIHQENTKAVKRNRFAVILASMVGFLVGFVFSFALPYFNNMANELKESIPSDSILSKLNLVLEFQDLIAWVVIGGTAVWAAVSTYNAVLSFQPLISVRRED